MQPGVPSEGGTLDVGPIHNPLGHRCRRPRQHQQPGRLSRPKRRRRRHRRPKRLGATPPPPSTQGGILSSLRTIVESPTCSRSPLPPLHSFFILSETEMFDLVGSMPPVGEGLGYATPLVGEGADMFFEMYSLYILM